MASVRTGGQPNVGCPFSFLTPHPVEVLNVLSYTKLMPWYIYALLAVAIGSFGGILQKWALNLKVNKLQFLAYVFTGLLIFYFFYNINHLSSLITSPAFNLYLLWGFLAAIFSMIGNIAGLFAYEKSANPGYVQVVASLNTILVMFAVVILFGSSISFLKVIGAVISVLGLIPLFYRKNNLNSHHGWQLPAILAMLSYGAMFLVVKQMSNLGFSAAEILLVLFFFASIGFWILHLKKRPKPVNSRYPIFIPIIAYILVAFLANLFNFTAINIAPNAGYVLTIGNLGVILVLILAIIFFPSDKGGEFNLAKWLGALLIILGVILTII